MAVQTEIRLNQEFDFCGFPCVTTRQPTGHLCGYVGIPDTHPLYSVKVNDITSDMVPIVHGGVTYADHHYPITGSMDSRWWVGFDCAHALDWFDWKKNSGRVKTPMYHEWTVEEVVEETKQLARELDRINREWRER